MISPVGADLTAQQGPAQILEGFARDLLALIRAVRVYPREHPYLAESLERIVATVRGELPDPFSLGVSPAELNVGGVYAGGGGSRAAQLAGLLHGRRVVRVLWTRQADATDAAKFAALLADAGRQGEELQQALEAQRIRTIAVDILDVARIHETFRESDGGDAGELDEQGRRAWRWLLEEGVTPQEIAGAMVSASFWELPTDASAAAEAAAGLALVLARLGDRLRRAMELLSAEERHGVEERLVTLGGRISADHLAAFLEAADRGGGFHGPAVTALTRGVEGERLVALLAALASREGRNTRRLADVFRRFAPAGGGQELLPVVRARLASSREAGLAVQVWEAVEAFLLDLQEDPFMEPEYAESLDELAEGPQLLADGEAHLDLLEDPSRHLDRVLLALACEDRESWGQPLLARLEERFADAPVVEFVGLLDAVDETMPRLLDERPGLLERVLREGAARLRDLDTAGREILLAFVLRHEGVLLDPVMKALADEERISVRRFLVDVISGFSPAATPTLIVRMRTAPWYVTRNLAIALGRRGEIRTVPALRALLEHPHAKVRREAVVALARLGGSARSVLEEVGAGRLGTREERVLATRVLAGAAEGVS